MPSSLRLILSLPLLYSCLFYSFLGSSQYKCNPFCLSSLLLSPFSSPVPLDMTKTQERKNKRGMEALFLSSLVSMDGESERGWLLVRRPSPCFSKALLSPYRLCSFPSSQTEKENGFLCMFIVLPFVFFEREKNKRRKMNTSTIFS